MNVGEVEIELDGKKEVLRSSLGAAKKVNAAGGFTNVLNKLLAYDLDYFVTVIAAGMDKKPSQVEERVFKTGLPKLLPNVSLYVGYLANGGRPVDPDAGDKDTGEG